MMLRLLLSLVLLADGAYSLVQNDRAEQLKDTVEDLLGDRADHYLVAALLGLGELALGASLLFGLARGALRRPAPLGRAP